MLSELYIENVAVIEKAEIRFYPGLNVLTGETGAGKSILIDSINAILGNRTSKDIVRAGRDKAVIWAVFDDVGDHLSERLKTLALYDEGPLILYREISADGGSRCRINQRPATAALVREICSGLINIHGQHDNQELLNPERHIYIFDRFADLAGTVSDFSARYQRMTGLLRQLETMETDDAQKERQMDLLRYQIGEIEEAELLPGEDGELTRQRNIIRNAEKIMAALHAAAGCLSGTDEERGAVSLLYDAMTAAGEAAAIDPAYAELYQTASDQYYSLSDLSETAAGALADFDYSISSLPDIEERLDAIYRLKRKYGASIEEIFAFLEDAKKQLENIETGDRRREELSRELSALERETEQAAKDLSEKRQAYFSAFEENIKKELDYLNMSGAQFSVRRRQSELGPLGMDSLAFYLSTNAGEPPKPLSRIASGGELSRIMLAIKNVMAEKDEIRTLIFDEIDTGISGNTAFKTGKKLKQSAASRQTICVTHSAQIASFADRHLLISKDVHDGRTFTSVDLLEDSARSRELARMISGDNITETSLQNAKEMLSSAKTEK